MQIELTAAEAKLVESALDAYEKDPMNNCLFSMFMLGLGPKRTDEEKSAAMDASRIEAERLMAMRKRATIMLRAKLIQASDLADTQRGTQIIEA